MTKIDIFSGFLGAGKTTLIKKLIAEAYTGEQLVLIENEFGEIGIDGGFLQEAGISITEMNSGCICCSLVGDFGKALQQVMETARGGAAAQPTAQEEAMPASAAAAAGPWACPACGGQNSGKFCEYCGTPRPQ